MFFTLWAVLSFRVGLFSVCALGDGGVRVRVRVRVRGGGVTVP